ncbi:MAG: alpha/beta hydrolase [Comamonadaceae bacterium]|nr:alpha/beta hydrolase [Comamonadaceae bacterium]
MSVAAATSIRSTFDHRCGHALAVGDAQIYFEEAGKPSGPPLLCLHGGLGDVRDLNPVLPVLAGRFRLIGIDFRGHGRSTLGSQPLTYAQHQANVLAVLQHLGIAAARVLGFSDGGIVAYRLAADGGAFKVLQLAAIGAQWRLTPNDPSLPLLQGLTAADWAGMFPEALPYYQAHNPQPDFDRLLAQVKAMWTNSQAGNYPGEAVRSISAPTLLIRGDRDELCNLQELAELQQRIAGSTLLNLPFANHAVQAKWPDTVSTFLNTFFERALPPT